MSTGISLTNDIQTTEGNNELNTNNINEPINTETVLVYQSSDMLYNNEGNNQTTKITIDGENVTIGNVWNVCIYIRIYICTYLYIYMYIYCKYTNVL